MSEIFFILGSIIVLGFFSLLFFERTKIPDVLILMSTGILISEMLPADQRELFTGFAPVFGALALMMILFDGGINLKFYRVLKELPTATAFTLSVFALNLVFVMLVMNVLFGWDLLTGLLLGAVIGGTSSAIVIPIVSKMSVCDHTKIFLTLESTLTDALCIIGAITIAKIIDYGSVDFSTVTNSLLGAFSIAAILGVLFGIAWIMILGRFHDMPFGYLLTIAVIFVLYSIVEFSKGSGAIGAFVFGLMLGNSTDVARLLHIESNFIVKERIRSFHQEFSFFLRTFFFIYLGLIFNSEMLRFDVLLMSFAVFLAVILSRYIPTIVLRKNKKEFLNTGILIASMMPRGLAAAVLASNQDITGGASAFINVVILVIIFTNIMATVGSFFYEKVRVEEVCPATEKPASEEENKEKELKVS